MPNTTNAGYTAYIMGTPATTRRKSWRRFRARGSSSLAPRLEWAQHAPRWSPAEEAQAAPAAETQAVGIPVAGIPVAGIPVAATTAVAIRVAPTADRRKRPAGMPRQGGGVSRASPRVRQGGPSSFRIREIPLS